MTRLDRLPSYEREHLLALPCPDYEETPLVKGVELNRRKVAIISTAGLQRELYLTPYWPYRISIEIWNPDA